MIFVLSNRLSDRREHDAETSDGGRDRGVLSMPAAGIRGEAQDRDVKFVLDFISLGRHAPWYVALGKGYFKEEGLNVTILPSKGTADAIRTVVTRRRRIRLHRHSEPGRSRRRRRADPDRRGQLPEAALLHLQSQSGRQYRQRRRS